MAIVGKSGSGKSTLLKILGGLERPSAGKVIYNGMALNEFSEQELFDYRNNNIGFVWQKSSDNLLPFLTAAENVAMLLIFKGVKAKERRERAHLLLDMVGLSDRYDSYPNQLSGGEQQRVAIAIALSGAPDILLMDEPTGAVDRRTSEELQELFKKLNREENITVIIVTHDISLAKNVDRVVMISDGKISSERLLDGEYSVLDKAGRVRLSKELRDAVGINTNRVKLEIEGGKLIVVPSNV